MKAAAINDIELSDVLAWIDKQRGLSIEADIDYDYASVCLVNAANRQGN